MDVRQKGKRFEREIAKRVGGYRVPMSGALPGWKGDVRDHSGAFSDWIIECKHQERGSLWSFVDQAIGEVGSSMKDWVVVWKKNRLNPVAIMDFEAWCNLVEELDQLREYKAKYEGGAE